MEIPFRTPLCVLIIARFKLFVKTFFLFFLGAVGDSNPHFNFSPHLGDTLTCSPVFAGGATRTHIIPLPTQPKTPATDGRTRLERVEWHNGGLSATEAHHLRFVPLLYHTLRGLSRGFINFFERSYLQWSVPRTLSS